MTTTLLPANQLIPNDFKPWRRRIGILTLVLACSATAGWVRSSYKIDECAISPLRGSQLIFVSGHKKFGVRFAAGATHTISMNCQFEDGRISRSQSRFRDTTFFDRRESDALSGAVKVLEFQEWIDDDNSAGIFLYPYWSIVVPLMLLSGWLLLSDRRKSKPEPSPVSDKKRKAKSRRGRK